MKKRRGSISRVGTVMERMLSVFEAGDIVTPVVDPEGHFLGVVESVCPKAGKVNVLWIGGSDRQHDPDEIVLEPNQNELVKTRMMRSRRAMTGSDEQVPYGDQYTGCPETQGVEEPRGGGFSIMQDLQRDLRRQQEIRRRSGGLSVPQRHQKNIRRLVAAVSLGVSGDDVLDAYIKRYGEIESDADKRHFSKAFGKRLKDVAEALDRGDVADFTKHLSLSSNYVGKVTRAIMDVMGIRNARNLGDLFEKMGGAESSPKSRRAMYWGGPGRTYRLTKHEQQKGKCFCPRCKKNMRVEPFTKSDKLYECRHCGFKVPQSKTTTKRITIDVDKQTGEVDVNVEGKTARGGRRGVMASRWRDEAFRWIDEQDTKFARTYREKAKYLVSKTVPSEMPHPAVWNEVLKISRGFKSSEIAERIVAGATATFKCPDCGTKVLKNTGYCVKCEQKVKEGSLERIAARVCSYVDTAELAGLSRMSLSEIAALIMRDWGSKVYFGAKPYLQAMLSLRDIKDNYGLDSGSSIVAYFLANAQSWRGETAKVVKKELNQRLKRAR